jgi:hypothetical protein
MPNVFVLRPVGSSLLTPEMLRLATTLTILLLTIPAMSVELSRYRGAAEDGGALEYVFEGG